MTKTKTTFAGIFLGILWPSVAMAEDGAARTSDTQRGYAYTFDDDPLDATPTGARGALLRVRPRGKRTLLIRPRTHFVLEIFKSAEDL